ncbi:MAG: DNA polymerase/3'-5' exonuclease PolX [Planctomycetes bacterium]|nr:DNA polymerase/3'-5' exonuclease PolX [Planctomycetota bacterium]
MSTNTDLAKMFHTMATILEIKGENAFKISANTKVARALEDMVEDVGELDDITSISGIGKSSAKKIQQYTKTGKMYDYDELVKSIPSGLLDIMNVQGIGAKTVRRLWKEIDVVDIQTLKEAITDGRLESLPRMGAKTIQNISESIEFLASNADRTRIGIALPIASRLINHLKTIKGVTKITFAGSLRRGMETIGDIDILASTSDESLLAKQFCEMQDVEKILAQGKTKCSVRLNAGMQVDLRIVDKDKFGAALLYFTGSKEHNITLRERAISQKKKLNEYGLSPSNISCTEEAIYADLELPWIPPEIREDHGEFSVSKSHSLITISDICSDLHCHTTASDGHMSIEELGKMGMQLGYHTIAVTDHSQAQGQANGLKPDRLRRQIDSIHEINESMQGITILAGSEVDILPDGTLDFDDELLEMLDIVVASPHAALQQKTAEATKRLLAAIEHPLVHIIGHPTGRIINKRKGLELDIPSIVAAAAEHQTALELNSNSHRLDLRDTHVRATCDGNAFLAINTDSHHPEDFDQLQFGILTARRGWATPRDCINCMKHDELQTWLCRNC